MTHIKHKAIVIGISAGGFQALTQLVPKLKPGLPIIVVHHCCDNSDDFIADSLAKDCELPVRMVVDKEPVEPATVYLAPPGYHLYIEKIYSFSLSADPPWNHSRPSIDILFESAASVYRETLVGIVMTGANSDGTAGLKKIKDYGGLAVVQNPETASSSAMPSNALKNVDVDHILELAEIGPFINKLRNPERNDD